MPAVRFGGAVPLRPFRPSDVNAVASIVQDSLRENYPVSIYLDIHRWWREGFLLAEEDGVSTGFVAGVVNGPKNARILMLAVRASRRQRGIGTSLMDAFLRECVMRGLSTVELEVRISNKEAIRFYERYGFQVTQVLKRFYTDGEDGYKMMRHL